MAGGISHALTFNEPNLALNGAWASKPLAKEFVERMAACIAAAAQASGSSRFSLLNGGDPAPMIPGVTAAHVKGRQAIKAVRADLPVGLSLAIPDNVPAGPDSGIERKRSEIYGPFFAVIGDDDFVGVQTYGRSYVGNTHDVEPPTGIQKDEAGKEWFPQAVGNVVRWVHEVTKKPILVTENGIEDPTDLRRQRFIPEAVASVVAAKRDGVPVIGYIHWSLLDNFEWMSGYGPKFGLVSVDRQTFKRTIKPSAKIYGTIARTSVQG